jgi:hypothetical protein
LPGRGRSHVASCHLTFKHSSDILNR